MTSCSGRGECFQQCCCICCEDEYCEIPSDECTCGHRDHTHIIGGNTSSDIYCQKECIYNCQLIECHNFKLCSTKLPQVILDCHNGMCLHCAVMIGKIKFMEEKDECPICMENKNMVEIACGKHKLCLDCWKTLSETPDRPIPLSCPMCRESIWKWKRG